MGIITPSGRPISTQMVVSIRTYALGDPKAPQSASGSTVAVLHACTVSLPSDMSEPINTCQHSLKGVTGLEVRGKQTEISMPLGLRVERALAQQVER